MENFRKMNCDHNVVDRADQVVLAVDRVVQVVKVVDRGDVEVKVAE
jgi:hypothetical protein